MAEVILSPQLNRPQNSSMAKDGFIFWPIAIFYIIAFGPLLVGRFWLQDDFIGLLIWAVCFVCAFLMAAVYLLKWRWRKSLSLIFAPFIAGAIVTAQFYFGFDVQWTKFQVMRPYYVWSVRGVDLAAFEWPEQGVFLGGGWNETLIYDPSGQRMSDRKRYPSLAKYSGDTVEVRTMGGHFYLVTSSYGME